MVTEQSHALKCRMFWILISKFISGFFCSVCLTSCCFCLANVVLMPFVAIGSGFVWLISVCLATV